MMLLLPVSARATNAGAANKLMRDAAELEKKGDWRAAGELYWQILSRDKQAAPELRQRFLLCLRHVRLTDRHTDPTYRKRVGDLPLSKALTAYADALGKLQANYVDKDKIDLASLFRHGLAEVTLALADPTFTQAHLADVSPEAAAEFAKKFAAPWLR